MDEAVVSLCCMCIGTVDWNSNIDWIVQNVISMTFLVMI